MTGSVDADLRRLLGADALRGTQWSVELRDAMRRIGESLRRTAG